MEKVECGSSTTLAKFIGTAVSILGAFIATLYQGPSIRNLSFSYQHLRILFFYCFFIAIVSALLSFILEGDQGSWSLQPASKLMIVLYSGVFGGAFQVGIGLWCISRTGPLFIAMFQPLGIPIAAAVGIIFLGDPFYLGTLVGSIIIVIGFYSVMWGKATEGKMGDSKEVKSSETTEETAPLLQHNV